MDNAKSFTAVLNSCWGKSFIDFASSRELFFGTNEATCSADQAMTRAMIVTVLTRFEGVDPSFDKAWSSAGRQ